MTLNDKAQKAWQFLIDEVKRESERLPDEFTVNEFADETGKPRETTRSFLDRKVERGELSKRKVRWNGRWVNVYRAMQEQ